MTCHFSLCHSVRVWKFAATETHANMHKWNNKILVSLGAMRLWRDTRTHHGSTMCSWLRCICYRFVRSNVPWSFYLFNVEVNWQSTVKFICIFPFAFCHSVFFLGRIRIERKKYGANCSIFGFLCAISKLIMHLFAFDWPLLLLLLCIYN